MDTVSLLCFPAENGHKVSKDKLQLVTQSVRYLGHIITPEGHKLGPDHIQAILDVPKPQMKKQIMSFLGLAGYCHPWICDFAEISRPLYDITHGEKHLAMTDFLTWTSEAEKAFTDLKKALSSSSCLGLTDSAKPIISDWVKMAPSMAAVVVPCVVFCLFCIVPVTCFTSYTKEELLHI